MNRDLPVYVKLIDGEIVLRDAEEWRHECEARHMLSIKPRAAVLAELAEIEKRRGNGKAIGAVFFEAIKLGGGKGSLGRSAEAEGVAETLAGNYADEIRAGWLKTSRVTGEGQSLA